MTVTDGDHLHACLHIALHSGETHTPDGSTTKEVAEDLESPEID